MSQCIIGLGQQAYQNFDELLITCRRLEDSIKNTDGDLQAKTSVDNMLLLLNSLNQSVKTLQYFELANAYDKFEDGFYKKLRKISHEYIPRSKFWEENTLYYVLTRRLEVVDWTTIVMAHFSLSTEYKSSDDYNTIEDFVKHYFEHMDFIVHDVNEYVQSILPTVDDYDKKLTDILHILQPADVEGKLTMLNRRLSRIRVLENVNMLESKDVKKNEK